MQPIILTVINRKEQLQHVDAFIENINRQFEELGIRPFIYIRSLYDFDCRFANVYYVPYDTITFNEQFLLDKYSGSYIINQHINVAVKDGIYKWIHCEMISGHNAILFHWANPVCSANCWRIDLFVYKDIKYLPNRGENSENDVLEVGWGKYLLQHNINSFLKSHNSNNNKFYVVQDKPICIPQIQEVVKEIIVKEEKKMGWLEFIKRWILWLE
jgi:hypothetical protein